MQSIMEYNASIEAIQKQQINTDELIIKIHEHISLLSDPTPPQLMHVGGKGGRNEVDHNPTSMVKTTCTVKRFPVEVL